MSVVEGWDFGVVENTTRQGGWYPVLLQDFASFDQRIANCSNSEAFFRCNFSLIRER
jgi:hypothetical protein